MRSTPAVAIFISYLLLNGCAGILNSNTREINVHTTKPSKIVFGKDTIATVNNTAYIVAKRQKQPVTFSVIRNDTVKTITLRSRNSINFYANIYTWGIGFIPDWNNPKRYSYRPHVFVNSGELSNRTYRYDQRSRKNKLFLHLSLPHINALYFKPKGQGNQFSVGFFGLAVGLDYYYREKQFLSVTTDFAANLPTPVPVPINDASGDYMHTFFTSVSNNHAVRQFTFGYGLTVAQNSWGYNPGWQDDSFPQRKQQRERHTAAGLIFTSYIKTGRSFNIGVIYRPTFFRFNTPDPFEYEHYLGIDFAWKIRLGR